MVDESISRKTDQIYEVQLSKNYLNMLFSNNNSKQLIPNSKVPPCWYSEDESDKINVEKRKLNFQELKTSKKIKDDQTKFIEPALKTRRQPPCATQVGLMRAGLGRAPHPGKKMRQFPINSIV